MISYSEYFPSGPIYFADISVGAARGEHRFFLSILCRLVSFTINFPRAFVGGVYKYKTRESFLFKREADIACWT